MSGNPKGELRLTVAGQEYRLHLGMSVLADLQSKHGQNVLDKLDTPKGETPPVAILCDMVLWSLHRHHPDADKYLADDIMAECPDVAGQLLAAAFGDKSETGNARKKAAAS